MISRYTRPGMAAVWGEENRYRKWFEVEALALEAWAELGEVPGESVAALRSARLDLDRIAAIEAEIHHDIVAFTTSLAEQVGEHGKFIHYGLTSTDVVDTAQAVLVMEAADLLLKELDGLIEVLAAQARRYKRAVMIGRTHGVHAEPTTLGLKFALWYTEMMRNRRRLEQARKTMAVGKISGSAGTFANVPPFVEAYVCRKLGLEPAPVSTQVLQRDRHAELLTTLAIIGGSLEKIATEIRSLQRTEVRELEEPFRSGQKGSSSMPHKRNPEKAERICGLARLLRGYALTALEDMPLWHERDISHSSAERVILPDATILLDYMLNMMAGILRDLHVYPERMLANLELTGGLIFSQRVLLTLVDRGMSREEAYALVQEHAMAAWSEPGGPDFRGRIAADPSVHERLTEAEVEALFDPSYHLRHVDEIFARAGLAGPTGPAGVEAAEER